MSNNTENGSAVPGTVSDKSIEEMCIYDTLHQDEGDLCCTRSRRNVSMNLLWYL